MPTWWVRRDPSLVGRWVRSWGAHLAETLVKLTTVVVVWSSTAPFGGVENAGRSVVWKV